MTNGMAGKLVSKPNNILDNGWFGYNSILQNNKEDSSGFYKRSKGGYGFAS